MYIDWTKNLKIDEDKKDFQRQVISAKPVLTRLSELIAEKCNEFEDLAISFKTFDKPNWEVRQAAYIGVKGMASYIQKLIDLDHQREINVRTEHFAG